MDEKNDILHRTKHEILNLIPAEKQENANRTIEAYIFNCISVLASAAGSVKGKVPDEKIEAEAMKATLEAIETEFADSFTQIKNIFQFVPNDRKEETAAIFLAQYPYAMIMFGGSPAKIAKQIDGLCEEYGVESRFATIFSRKKLSKDQLAEISKRYSSTKDSGKFVVNNNPVVKQLMRPKERENEKRNVLLSSPEKNLRVTVEGAIDPFEMGILEAIMKAECLEKQVTAAGEIYFTVGQLYRILRGGSKDSPQQAQKEKLLEKLQQMERKIPLEFSEPIEDYCGQLTHSGMFRLISFDQHEGTINGNKETLILLSRTPILNFLSTAYRTYEFIPQEYEAIQERVYTATIGGKTVRGNRRKLKEEFSKAGLGIPNFENLQYTMKLMKMTYQKIMFREVLKSFAYSYLRARGADKKYSNKIRYDEIFMKCGIDPNDRKISVKKDTIFTIMDFYQDRGLISSWKEYTNSGEKKPSGIEIKISTKQGGTK